MHPGDVLGELIERAPRAAALAPVGPSTQVGPGDECGDWNACPLARMGRTQLKAIGARVMVISVPSRI